MRYAPFNCCKVFIIFCPFAEQEPGCCLSNGCYQNQRSVAGGSERRVTSALVLSTEQLFGTGTAQYIVS